MTIFRKIEINLQNCRVPLMNNDLIFLPVLAHVVLIFMLYIYLGMVKSRAVKAGNVDRKDAALNA